MPSPILNLVRSIASSDFRVGQLALLKKLGYTSDKQMPVSGANPMLFVEMAESYSSTRLDRDKAKLDEWTKADILFQLTDDELGGQESLFKAAEIKPGLLQSYLFFAIELKGSDYSRSALSDITRQINRLFPMPVMVLFTYFGKLSIAVINRRQNKREQYKDVLGKVTLIHDVDLAKPHRGHLEILESFSVSALATAKRKIDSFDNLHSAWEEVFNVELLNKKFYRELSNWYFWAIHNCHFPYLDPETDKYDLFKDKEKVREHDAKNLIRLLTRILFIWFIKQKGLVPDSFFDQEELKEDLLGNFDAESQETNYYKAILQNFFFATLNQTHGKRAFRNEGQHQNTTTLLRYKSLLKNPDKFIEIVEATTPFLNGGLFDCLDYPHPTLKGPQGGDVIVYEDGFSDRKDNPLDVPDYLFFGASREVDLSEDYGDKKRKTESVQGLFHILNGYKFTIVENTPVEQEVALDPELLGQVFENLLASYNEETKSTARKQTGSFYTPRPIVDYMVDESLKAHLQKTLIKDVSMSEADAQEGLDILFAYREKEHAFTDEEKDALIRAIDRCKILDPACGSGAFPMGALQKLVYVLSKLDKNDELWEHRQLANVDSDLALAKRIEDSEARQLTIEDLQAKRKDIEEAFAKNELGYGRKLYLIENCLYGVDIQSIATQVSKLRFFISLIVDQKVDRHRNNFGIRPLPNLETKFVTADTLIQIEKPKVQGELFEIAKVSKLQKELKRVRHDLFSAKTPRTKRKHRERDEELRAAIAEELKENGWSNDAADKLAAWDPYDQNASAPYFDPEWMFGLAGFDVVIGNPPYVSTKGRSSDDKAQLKTAYGFSDDLYNHFYFKAFELTVASGVIAYITSKTFWTTLTKKNLRTLLLSKHLIEIFDTAQPFEAMVDTCVLFAQNEESLKGQLMSFKDGKKDLLDPFSYSVNRDVYEDASNEVFFIPTHKNLSIYNAYNSAVSNLLNQWWGKINTSQKIEKNRAKLEQYKQSLKPGDLTLLGLISDGGVGLQTGNNGGYLAVRDGTKQASAIRIARPKKLFSAVVSEDISQLKHITSNIDAAAYLNDLSELEVASLFDQLKAQYDLRIFGKGFIYKIIQQAHIAEVDSLSSEEKNSGIIKEKPHWLPYDKGDRDGNRWYLPSPFLIDWSKESVSRLSSDPRARWQGNQFFFREGFCWTNVLNPNARMIKCRMKGASVNDVGAMALYSNSPQATAQFITVLLNSSFLFEYLRTFINASVNLQLNDFRVFPIIIPTDKQLKEAEGIFERAINIKKAQFSGEIEELVAQKQLTNIQSDVDTFTKCLYRLPLDLEDSSRVEHAS